MGRLPRVPQPRVPLQSELRAELRAEQAAHRVAHLVAHRAVINEGDIHYMHWVFYRSYANGFINFFKITKSAFTYQSNERACFY